MGYLSSTSDLCLFYIVLTPCRSEEKRLYSQARPTSILIFETNSHESLLLEQKSVGFYNLPIFEILVHLKGSSKEGIFTACCDININMVIKICSSMDACQTCSAVIGGHQFHEEEWNDLWLKSLTHNGKSKHKKMTAEMRKIEFAQKCWAFEIMSILFSRRETMNYSVCLSVSHKRNNTLFLYW